MTLKEVIEILENTDLEYEFLCEFDDAINISISIYKEEDDKDDEEDGKYKNLDMKRIEEDKESILLALVTDEAENAPPETMLENYVSTEFSYWQERNLSTAELVSGIKNKGNDSFEKLLGDCKL